MEYLGIIHEITKYLKLSQFKTWTALSKHLEYGSCTNAIKQKIERQVKSLNEILKPLGVELWIRKIEEEK